MHVRLLASAIRHRFSPWWLLVGLVLLFAATADHDRTARVPSATTPTATSPTAATSGTDVCGTLPGGETVWTAAAAPYSICAEGVTVPPDGTLTLSGAAGGFPVVASSGGGLHVQGTLRTLLTTPGTRVRFDGKSTTPGSWAGLDATRGATMTLDSVDIEHAVDGLRTDQASAVSITNASVGDSSRDGISVTQDTGRPTLAHVTVDGAARFGIAVHGPMYGMITASLTDLQVSRSGTDSHALAPAVLLDGVDGSWGTGGDISGLSGGGNGVDAVAWSGTIATDLDWLSPTNASTVHPLGLVPIGLSVDGDLRLPAGAVVRGANDPHRAAWALRVKGSVTAVAGDSAVFPLRDATRGPAFCPSALATNPCGYDTDVTVEPPGPATVALDGSQWHYSSLEVRSVAATASITHSSFEHVAVTSSATTTLTGDTWTSGSTLTTVGPRLTLAAGTFQNSTFQPGGSSVVVTGTAFDASPVRAAHTGMDQLSLTFCTFRNAPGSALDITGDILYDGSGPPPAYRPVVTLQDSTFTNNGHYGQIAPAVRLAAVDTRLGPGATIDRVTGSNNGIDAMAIGGREEGSFTWQSPSQSPSAHPLGYLILSELRVGRPALVTIPQGAVVKGGELRLEGTDLDATAGGAVFTGFWDNSAGSPTCPSTLLDNCVNRNFTGIGLLRGSDAAGDMGTVQVAGATFRYSHIAYGDPTWNWGPMNGGTMVLRDTTGDHSSFTSPSGSLVVDHVTVTGGGVSASGPLTVTNSTISTDPTTTDQFRSALSDEYLGVTPISVSDTTLSGGGIFLINQDDQHLNPDIKLQRVSVSGERSGSAVVRLHNASVTLGPGRDIDAVSGNSNGLDAMTVDGEIRGDFTWTGLANSAVPHPLGLITPKPVRLLGPGIMTVPHGALVKASDLDLRGVTIDATAGGATFAPTTGGKENLDVPTCRATPTGLQGSCQDLLVLQNPNEPDGAQSGLDLADAHLVDTRVLIAAHDDGRHLRWSGGAAENVTLGSRGGPLELRNLTLGWSNINMADSSGNVLDHLTISDAPATPVRATRASGTLTSTRIDGLVFTPWDPAPFVVTSDTQPWTLRCDAITNNTAGVAVPDGSTISASNLYRTDPDPHRFDLSSPLGVHTTADGVWWGQPGGPQPGQIDGPVVVTNSAATPQPVGSITTSGSAMRADGSAGTGALVVSVATSRPMDISVPLVVTLTGSNGVAHPVPGSWTDDSHWSGSYTVTSTSASSGSNTVNASGGRGCVPDPTTAVMSPASRTLTINAPSPAPAPSPIAAKYASLGGAKSVLGKPSGGEYAIGSGRGQNYTGGRIYWTSSTGAHEVHGTILTRYLNAGGPTGFLGFPTSDEVASGKGRVNTFTGGNIFWSSGTGAHSVQGAILVEYRAMGGPSGALGLPTSDETKTPDKVGRYNTFQIGSIYWTAATGAHEVQGKIRDKWRSLGAERSRLGYPTRDEYAVTGGRRSDFQRGTITWNAKTGATTVTYR